MGRSRLCGSSCRKWVSILWLNCFFVFFCEIANNFQFSGPFLSPPMLSLHQTKHGGSALRWVDYLTVINDFFGANCWSFNLQLCGYFLEVHIVLETGLVATNKPRIHCTKNHCLHFWPSSLSIILRSAPLYIPSMSASSKLCVST